MNVKTKTFSIFLILILMPVFFGFILEAQDSDLVVTIGEVLPDSPVRPLLGVNMGPVPTGAGDLDLTERYREIGVTAIRTHDYQGPFDMSQIYNQNLPPNFEGAYDFVESDVVFQSILDGPFQPYLRLGNSWGTSARPINNENFIQAMVHVVEHYNDAERWGGNHLRYVEIWNEPDSSNFWDGTYPQFYEFFEQALRTLQAEFPDLKFGGPGITGGGQTFAEGLLSHLRDSGTTPDFFSWHFYSNNPSDYTSRAETYRNLLNSYGFTATESHISEWNTNTNNLRPGWTVDDVRRGGLGAAILTAAWIGLQEQGVDFATFYRGPDPSESGTFYGLFYADATYKRSARVFSLWKQMTEKENRLNISLDRTDTGLWILASQNLDGETALLIANPTDNPLNWSLSADSLYTLNGASGQMVNDTNEEIQTFSLLSPTASVGAREVQLILLPYAERPPLFEDTFDDGTMDWVTGRGTWTESSGSLSSTTNSEATIYAPTPWSSGVSGCDICTFEVDDIATTGGSNSKVTILAFYENDNNKVEVELQEDKDKIVLRQKVSGTTVVSQTITGVAIERNTPFDVQIGYDGANLQLGFNGTALLTVSTSAVPYGNAGFLIKKTTASFGEIRIED